MDDMNGSMSSKPDVNAVGVYIYLKLRKEIKQ